MADDQLYPDVQELDFQKSNLSKLYSSGEARGVNPERWERIRREVRFEDVVSDLVPYNGGNSMSCPFHGRDSTPSFWLYRGTNDGWCFGCPPKEQYYDHIRFVSKFLGITRVQALKWIEKKWNLAPIADIVSAEGDETSVVTLDLKDLVEPYILKAIRDVQAVKDAELAEEYLRFYFEAIQLEKLAEEAKKEGELEDAADLRTKAAMTLARILGKEEIDRILERK